jgi:hypothetical protein
MQVTIERRETFSDGINAQHADVTALQRHFGGVNAALA